MTTSPRQTPPTNPAPRARTRRRDRRASTLDLLRGLVADTETVQGLRALQARLTEAVRQVLPVRTIAIHDGFLRPVGRAHPASAPLRLALPLSQDQRPLALEIEFEPGVRPDEWDRQFLEMVQHLVALVVRVAGTGVEVDGIAPPSSLLARDSTWPLIGSSQTMQAVQHLVSRVAPTPFTVLIQGESGTGKELIARQVHARSARRAGPFVAVNCAAIVDTLLEAELFGIEDRTATGVRGRRGKFEEAHGGTLFLDEVVDLSGPAQAKLLRALQDFTIERVGGHQSRTLDVRVIAATNQSLESLVKTRQFRADLFHRLAGFEIALPPLRDRGADVLELAAHFLRKHTGGRRMSLSPPAADCLLAYGWPGNVRELERVIQRALVLTDSDVLEPCDFPRAVAEPYHERLQPAVDASDTLRLWTARFVRLIVSRCASKTEAAQRLGISVPTLRAYLAPATDARRVRRRSRAA